MSRWERNPRIVLREMDDSVFLADPDSECLLYLNALGAAIWRLLERPAGEPEVVATVQQAFPEVDPQTVAADVSGLLRELAARDLILAAANGKPTG